MSMMGGGGYRRYGLLRGAGVAMFVFCTLFAVLAAVLIIVMIVMTSSMSRYGGPPSWFYLTMLVVMVFLVGYFLVFGLAFKLLSAALAESGDRLEHVRTLLHGRASGMR
jgi:ABC-type siderophore export system fused ATPase/permease subunit